MGRDGGEGETDIGERRHGEVDPGAARERHQRGEQQNRRGKYPWTRSQGPFAHHLIENIDDGRDEERAEHVGILERATHPAEFGGEQLARSGHEAEIADQSDHGRDQRRDQIGRHDQLDITLWPVQHERRHHHRGQREIQRDGHMLDWHVENAGLRGGDISAGHHQRPQHEIENDAAGKPDEADHRQNQDRADHQCVVRRRLGEHDAAERDREPQIGQREPLDVRADLPRAVVKDRRFGGSVRGHHRLASFD